MTNGTCVSTMHGGNDRSIEASQKRFMFDGLHRSHTSIIVLSGRWVCMVACVIVLRGQPAAGQPVTKQANFVPPSVNDSLALQLLDIAIAKAEVEACAANFWHRLIPSVSVSATIGVRQLAFIDPTTSTPYIFPKDSYRLNATLSLSAIFNTATHEEAVLDLQRLQAQKELALREYEAKRNKRLFEIQSLNNQLLSLKEELNLQKKILDFKQLLFDQGKVNFDELSKAQIVVLHLKRSIGEQEIRLISLQRGLE